MPRIFPSAFDCRKRWSKVFLAPDAQIAGAGIDQLFEQEGRFRSPCSAIGIDGRGVRVDTGDRHVERLNIVDACRHGGADIGDEGTVLRDIRAQIGDEIDPHAKETVICVHRHLGCHHIVAPLGVGEEMFGAVTRPFDRTAQPFCGFEHQRMFAIDEGLRPEAAAHVGRDDAELFAFDAEHLAGEDIAHRVHALRAGRQYEPVLVGAPFADRRPRLHVVADQPVVDEFDACDRLGVGESRIGLDAIAHFIGEGLVGAELGPHQGRPGIQRGACSGGCLLPVILDLDQFGSVLRKRPALRHDERDGVPDIVHTIPAEDGDVARRRALAVRLLLHHPRLERSEVGDILPCQNQVHTGRLSGGIGQYAGDPCLRNRRSQHEAVKQTFRRYVVRIPALTGNEGLVFQAQDGSAQPEFRRDDGHDCSTTMMGKSDNRYAHRQFCRVDGACKGQRPVFVVPPAYDG